MNNMMLQFDFQTNNSKKPVVFTNPIEIITTKEYDKIPHCLQEIERAINEGYYVAGYFNYEVAYSFYDVQTTHRNESMPLLSFGIFEEPTHKPLSPSNIYDVSKWKMKISRENYEENFAKIMDAIHNGVTDQVNYTVPFEATFSGDSLRYYEDLKRAQQASYSAYIHTNDLDIVSVSPELFFHYEDGEITVRPMKGTVKRGKSYEEDQRQFHALQTSEKDRHENRLITALMKEELIQVADPSTIKVTEAFTIEQYPTVYQMTSTIVGKVNHGMSMTNLFRNLFPCGSISGAPKQETMQLIADVEPYERGVYCGAIGYFTPDNKAIFNVPIRTVSIDRNEGIATYGAGGAITKKSHVKDEFDEVHTKTKVLTYREPNFQLLETFGLYDGEIIVKEGHIKRLKQSANYFNFHFNDVTMEDILTNYRKTHQKGHYRIRCILHKDGTVNHEIFPLEKNVHKIVTLAATPINRSNKFLYHKTTYRHMYAQLKNDNYFETLLWNEKNEITEFTIGNVVVEINDTLYTPPISSGLLNGTFRQKLIQDQMIHERIIYKDELKTVTNIWLINSVRKWVKVVF